MIKKKEREREMVKEILKNIKGSKMDFGGQWEGVQRGNYKKKIVKLSRDS